MLNKFSKVCVNVVQKLLPDPFIFCILLTIFVFIIAMPLTRQGPIAMVQHWGNGVWGLLAFSMQMALVLVLGSAMASAPIIKKILRALASIPKTPFQAILMVTAISLVACWANWGFGLIVGAIFAKEIARQLKGVDYPLLIASAYSGFVVWHAGISGSIPLTVATIDESVVAQTAGALTVPLPTSSTIFSPCNLIICIAILIILPLVNAKMHPMPQDVVTVDPSLLEEESINFKQPETPAEKMENSMILSAFVVIFGAAYVIYTVIQGTFTLSLNSVNLIFLVLGVAFHKTPISYVRAIADAAKGAAGIILQFPFYAGIQGLMVGVSAHTGLSFAGVISNTFVTISNSVTFPLFTFWSAGIVNFFIPSGGGQWAVQAPIMMPAGSDLNVHPSLTAMSIAWGDAWTNLLQPFWALPALGIAKLGARDIMGYCIVGLLLTGLLISLGLLAAGAGIIPLGT